MEAGMFRGAAFAVAMALAGCGMFGADEPEAPVDPCPRVELPDRRLAGAMIRQPAGSGLYEIVPVEGKTTRSGEIARLRLGDYTFKARPGADGALRGRRGARAEPVDGIGATALAAYSVSYRHEGQDYAAQVVAGLPAAGAAIPEAGQGHYRGPVRLSVRSGTGAPVDVTGTADIQVRFASRQVDIGFDGLSGALPFARVAWTGIGMCGVRAGSTGKGGFQAFGPEGRPVDVVGPDGAAGKAVLDATFYGFDREAAQPKELAGVLLIQGDAGVVSGVFAAARAD